MIGFVHLTRYAAGRTFPVNPLAIAYLDVCGDGAVVAFGSGETIRVTETPTEIEQLVQQLQDHGVGSDQVVPQAHTEIDASPQEPDAPDHSKKSGRRA
jgi:hypothetical protein